MPDVVVVILNLNGRPFLDPCLNSLARLTVPVEIVVADNGSADDSVVYLREQYPRVRVVELGKNWGFAEGYNRALAAVDAPWAVMLNNDATLAPDWVERLLAVAERVPRAAILGGKLLFSGRGNARVIQSAGAKFTDSGAAFEIGMGEPDQGQYDRSALVASIPGAALLIKREVFFALGGFDPRYFAYLEDVDLCWRAWLAGYEVHYVPEAVAFHRYGQSGGGRASPFRIKWMERNRLANMFKHLEPASLAQALVISALYDLYRVLEFIARGHLTGLCALVAGNRAFWKDLRPILTERARIQRDRRISDRALRQRGLLVPVLTSFREYRRLNRLELSRESCVRE
jgi:GT2 family glycosyltransferase